MHLVTTSHQKTWDINKENLFLGKWCLLQSEKEVLSGLSYQVMPYHWDDRQKLHDDYLYLNGVIDRIENELYPQLNLLHNVNNSMRYWEILVGPWLRYFVHIVYDRFCSIENALQSYQINSISLLQYDLNDWIPLDTSMFAEFFVGDDWNHVIYSEIIKKMQGVNFEVLSSTLSTSITTTKNISLKSSVLDKINKVLLYASCVKSAMGTEIAFTSETLSLMQMYLMKSTLKKSMSRVPTDSVMSEKKTASNSMRARISFNECENNFENILRYLIPRQLPISLVESYDLNLIKVKKKYPKKVRTIITSSCTTFDDMTKLWIAQMTEDGAQLIIHQHGGLYGLSKFSLLEDREVSISDEFISWGWSNNKKIVPGPSLKLQKLLGKVKPKSQSNVVCVLNSIPRYSYSIFSLPISSQYEKYIEKQCEFVSVLPLRIKEKLKIKLSPSYKEWDVAKRLKECLNETNILPYKTKLLEILAKSSICISTFNTTTLLETMSLNYPTLMYWDKDYFELNNEAEAELRKLESVYIFHEDGASLANFLEQIIDDPFAWWLSDNVQKVRQEFCKKYAYTSDNWKHEWGELLSIH